MRQTSLAHYDVVQDGKDHKVKHPVFTEQLLSNQLQTNLDKREHTRHLIKFLTQKFFFGCTWTIFIRF